MYLTIWEVAKFDTQNANQDRIATNNANFVQPISFCMGRLSNSMHFSEFYGNFCMLHASTTMQLE